MSDRRSQLIKHNAIPIGLFTTSSVIPPIIPPITFLRPYTTKSTSPTLTHLDEHGRASMVDVSDKNPTKRVAIAKGRISIPKVAYELVTATYPTESSQDARINKARRKGDALTVAQLAAIMGAKKTSDLIPLCHPLPLSKVEVTLTPEVDENSEYIITCQATAVTEGKTGVEMEALTAVSVGLLTVWDMLKAVAGKEMKIGDIFVSHKSGGRSGDFNRMD